MDIKKRVKKTIKANKEINSLMEKDKNIRKCVLFAKEMDMAGILNPERQYTAPISENGREQLKLFAQTPFYLN